MCSEFMRSQGHVEPSATFTQSVMSRIAAENTQPSSATWIDRVNGALRPIDRPLTIYQVAAACILLIVVMAAGAAHIGTIDSGRQPVVNSGSVSVADGSAAGSTTTPGMPQPGFVTTGGTDLSQGAAIENLVLRHESYEMSKPLGPDAGVLLVSRTSY